MLITKTVWLTLSSEFGVSVKKCLLMCFEVKNFVLVKVLEWFISINFVYFQIGCIQCTRRSGLPCYQCPKIGTLAHQPTNSEVMLSGVVGYWREVHR